MLGLLLADRVLGHMDYFRLLRELFGQAVQQGLGLRPIETGTEIVYLNADLVSYPSLYEGYGNAFVEAIYFKKPIVVNRYSIFAVDIEPKAFDTITFDGYFTKKKAAEIKTLLESPQRVAQMVETNYMLGWRYLSYEMLEEKLEQLLVNIYGA